MNNDVLLTTIELAISILIEGIIISMIFTFITNKASEKQNNTLKDEMHRMETQNRFQYEQLMNQVQNAKTETINQIKEQQKEVNK